MLHFKMCEWCWMVFVLNFSKRTTILSNTYIHFWKINVSNKSQHKNHTSNKVNLKKKKHSYTAQLYGFHAEHQIHILLVPLDKNEHCKFQLSVPKIVSDRNTYLVVYIGVAYTYIHEI